MSSWCIQEYIELVKTMCMRFCGGAECNDTFAVSVQVAGVRCCLLAKLSLGSPSAILTVRPIDDHSGYTSSEKNEVFQNRQTPTTKVLSDQNISTFAAVSRFANDGQDLPDNLIR